MPLFCRSSPGPRIVPEPSPRSIRSRGPWRLAEAPSSSGVSSRTGARLPSAPNRRLCVVDQRWSAWIRNPSASSAVAAAAAWVDGAPSPTVPNRHTMPPSRAGSNAASPAQPGSAATGPAPAESTAEVPRSSASPGGCIGLSVSGPDQVSRRSSPRGTNSDRAEDGEADVAGECNGVGPGGVGSLPRPRCGGDDAPESGAGSDPPGAPDVRPSSRLKIASSRAPVRRASKRSPVVAPAGSTAPAVSSTVSASRSRYITAACASGAGDGAGVRPPAGAAGVASVPVAESAAGPSTSIEPEPEPAARGRRSRS